MASVDASKSAATTLIFGLIVVTRNSTHYALAGVQLANRFT